MEIRDQIRNFIADNFMMGKNPDDLGDSDSLLDKGIIDSTGVLELIGFLEENYNIQISDEELVPENLDSVVRLVNFVNGKKPGR